MIATIKSATVAPTLSQTVAPSVPSTDAEIGGEAGVEINPKINAETITEQDYFDLEAQSEERHEYRQGDLIPMPRGTPNHSRIILNLAVSLKIGLKHQPYDIFSSDQRLWIPAIDRYTYPDVMVTRDPLEMKPGRTDTVMNPILLVEVLSASTWTYDMSDKFRAYRSIDGVVEYLTINQYEPHVEHHVKDDRGWLLRDVDGLAAKLVLESIPVEINLSDLYDKVEFAGEV